MGHNENWRVVCDITRTCAIDLFEAYGIALRDCETCELTDDATIMAAVGFAGEEMRGALAISLATSAVKASNVITASPTADQDRDWTGELANQLLGRLKNRLVRFGAQVSMGTPLVFAGSRFLVHSPKQSPNIRLGFTTDHGPIEVWIDTVFSPDTVLVEASDPADACEEEGTLLFF